MTPFVSEAQLRGIAVNLVELRRIRLLEAFTHHPKIGEDKAALQAVREDSCLVGIRTRGRRWCKRGNTEQTRRRQ